MQGSREDEEAQNRNDSVHSDSDNEVCDDDALIHLPRHFRCTCHSLNLIATTDMKKISNQQFLKLKRQIDGKLSAILKKQNRSSLASDFIKKTLGELFVINNETRWNSYYNALCKVHYFVSKKNEALNLVFDQFKVRKLTAIEQEFLKEFLK